MENYLKRQKCMPEEGDDCVSYEEASALVLMPVRPPEPSHRSAQLSALSPLPQFQVIGQAFAAHEGTAPVRRRACPGGADCSDPACDNLHPCPGRHCGHRGMLLPPNMFKTNADKRFKTCKELSAFSKKWNDKSNPINNPIKAAKLKVGRREEAEAFARKHGRTGILGNEARQQIAVQLAKDDTLFDGAEDPRLVGESVDSLFSNPKFCGYLGETGRNLEEEGFRWLSERGSSFTESGKNRPVLRWPAVRAGEEGHVISETQARKRLGFESVILWRNDEKLNTTYVEDALQRRYHHMGLPRRLHRRVGMGDSGRKEDENVHKVFLAYSFDVAAMIDSGEVVVVH